MKAEQIPIMKIIQFPKNKTVRCQKQLDKLEVAYQLLKMVVENGADFEIILKKKDGEKILEAPKEDYMRDYVILTTSLKFTDSIPFNQPRSIYEITGDEID